ncbi:MAG: DegT/DnrJ/EryC1/StrS family aminotransferase [Acidobacteriota bacterium]
MIRAKERASLIKHLAASGVPHDIHYPVADCLQEAWRSCETSCDIPNTIAACEEVLTLPCFPEMAAAEVEEVARAVNAWYGSP